MSPHAETLVRAFEALPPDFTPDDLDRVIANTLAGAPMEEWPAIAEEACGRYEQEARDRTTLFLANFRGTMQ